MKADKIYIEKAIKNISVYMVRWIQENYKCDREKALQQLMTTATYATLLDKNTKLFSESKEYVLDMLMSEIKNDIKNWMDI